MVILAAAGKITLFFIIIYIKEKLSYYWKFSFIFKFKTLFHVHYDEGGLHPEVEKKDDI